MRLDLPLFLARAASCGDIKCRACVGHHSSHFLQPSSARHFMSITGTKKAMSFFSSTFISDDLGLYFPLIKNEQTNSHILHPLHLSMSTISTLFTPTTLPHSRDNPLGFRVRYLSTIKYYCSLIRVSMCASFDYIEDGDTWIVQFSREVLGPMLKPRSIKTLLGIHSKNLS